jgi:hypothetical protein
MYSETTAPHKSGVYQQTLFEYFYSVIDYYCRCRGSACIIVQPNIFYVILQNSDMKKDDELLKCYIDLPV